MFFTGVEHFVLARFVTLMVLTLVIGGVGFLLLASIFPQELRSDPFEILFTSISLGIVTIVILVGGMSILNFSFSKIIPVFLILIFILSCCVFVNAFRGKISFLQRSQVDFSAIRFSLLFFLFLLAVRGVQTYDIFVPNWVDGLTHTMRLQKFILRDFIPFDRVYPSGFYSLAFIFNKFGMDLPETVLMLGQWLAAVSAINMYVLIRRYLGHSFWAYLSVFVYSFCLLFPSHLLAWGRYPFLLGLALVPPSILTTLDWINGHKKNYAMAIIFIVSLALSHYGAFLIWLSFVFAYLVLEGKLTAGRKGLWLRLFLLVLPLIVVFIPRMINLWNSPDVFANIINHSSTLEFDDDIRTVVNLIWKHDMFFIGVWAAGIILSALRREKLFFTLALWPLLFYLFTWIQYALLGFSVTSYINLAIFISIPIAFSFGYVVQHLDSLLIKLDAYRSLKSGMMKNRLISSMLVVFIFVFGAFLSLRDFNADTVLFNADDATAIAWMKNNTPRDAMILINSFVWGDKLMPSDGGGWINQLTGRQIIYPDIGTFYDMCEFIKKNNVDYIYLGKSPSSGFFDLRLDDLSGFYKIVYETKNVTIASTSCP